ncbi:IS66 family insertion sequence element accessory protein TnpB [Syntrophaceticus schinkii]|uniref:IS66 family insertion sequence element accessory protein TnpB n=1 Tax=Syntrophaceticus schinkii TaxID=499207 RepID=UPI000A042D89
MRDKVCAKEQDGDGFWLYFKRLERGHFRWPAKGDSVTMLLNTMELSYIIEGAKLEKKLKRKEVLERQIS